MNRARRALLMVGIFLAITAWLNYASDMYADAELREPPEYTLAEQVLPYDGLLAIAIMAAVLLVAQGIIVHHWYHHERKRNQNQLHNVDGGEQ